MDPRVVRVLARLEAESASERERGVPPGARMLAITRETGELLNMVMRMVGAADALEVGTSAGYSTVWLAEAARAGGGTVTTIEADPAKVERARSNLEDAGLGRHVRILEGQALDVLAGMGQEPRFGLAFIDADKENVAAYFDFVLPMVRRGGAIITDNMLHPAKYRGMMAEYARHVRATQGVISITLPVGNGEEITLKL